MAVFRVEKNHNYTVMSNYHLRDTRLTLKSIGLLSKMLSLTDEWDYTTRGLAAICKEGVDAIGAALKELESHGYLVRRQLRDSRGRITDTEYTIYESPHTPLPDTASIKAEDGTSKDYTLIVDKLPNETGATITISYEENGETKEKVIELDRNNKGTIRIGNQESVNLKVVARDELAQISIRKTAIGIFLTRRTMLSF